jgi:hypothetical protein
MNESVSVFLSILKLKNLYIVGCVQCDRHKESHRFIVVAPMGTAATLLNGSMYHSILGISDGKFISAGTLTQIRARLDGVNYIFWLRSPWSPVVTCIGLVLKLHSPWSAGITFIFSGNFTQLPPARSGPPLYLDNVGTQTNAEQSLWHPDHNCCHLPSKYETDRTDCTSH